MSTDAIPEDAEQLPPSAVPTPLVVPSMGDDSDPDLANAEADGEIRLPASFGCMGPSANSPGLDPYAGQVSSHVISASRRVVLTPMQKSNPAVGIPIEDEETRIGHGGKRLIGDGSYKVRDIECDSPHIRPRDPALVKSSVAAAFQSTASAAAALKQMKGSITRSKLPTLAALSIDEDNIEHHDELHHDGGIMDSRGLYLGDHLSGKPRGQDTPIIEHVDLDERMASGKGALRTSKDPLRGGDLVDKSAERSIMDETTIHTSFTAEAASLEERDFALDDDERDFFDRLHDFLHHRFNKTPMGLWWDLAQTILSFLSCGTYVFSTYWLEVHEALPLWLTALEIFMAVLFILDYIFRVYLAKNHRCAWICSTNSITDLIAIVPVIAIFVPEAQIGFMRLLRGIRVLRILRADRMFTEVDATTSLRRQYVMMGFTLLAFMFIAAGLVHLIDDVTNGEAFNKPDGYRGQCDGCAKVQLTFFDALYFVIITITTVGFGDFAPDLVVAKLVTIILIVCLLIILPRETDKISKIVEKTSEYDSRYKAPKDINHVVICGKASALALSRFLSEFYHADHGLQKARVVIMGPEEPETLLYDKVLSNTLYEDLVQYVKGSPLSDFDLRRVEASSALMFFVLSDPTSTDKQASDIDAIMCCKGISIHAPKLPIYAQCILASSKGNQSWAGWHQVMCIDEVKLGFIAVSANCPGFGTMLCNLIASSGDADCDVEWKEDYCVGFGQEMYCLPISESLIGWRFCEVATELYIKFGVCVFALSMPGAEPLINPANHVFLGDESAIVIADCIEEAQLVSNYNPVEGKPQAFPTGLADFPIVTPDIFAGERPAPLQKTPHSTPDFSNFAGHWIVCGNMEGLLQLSIPMRAVTSRPLVILHPNPGQGSEWRKLLELPNVFFCRGSAMEVRDLRRAGADTAEVIVILTDQQGVYASLQHRSADAFGIFVSNAIDEYFPTCRWVLEIVNETSLSQLECLPENRNEAYGLWPRYVSGMVYLSSSLDGLLAQCFYNSDLLGIVAKLVGGGGRPTSPSIDPTQAEENSEIGQIMVPPRYVGQSYRILYKDLCLNFGVVALGLFRDPEVYNPPPPLPVVLANPDPEMTLYQSDKVYVLRPKYDPTKHHMSKADENPSDEVSMRKTLRLPDGSTRTMVDHSMAVIEEELTPLDVWPQEANRRRFSTNTSIGSAPSALGSPVDPTKGGSSVPLVLTTTEANPVAGEGSQLDFHPVGSTPGEAPESSLQPQTSTPVAKTVSEGTSSLKEVVSSPPPPKPMMTEEELEVVDMGEVEGDVRPPMIAPLPPPVPSTPYHGQASSREGAARQPSSLLPPMTPIPPPTPSNGGRARG